MVSDILFQRNIKKWRLLIMNEQWSVELRLNIGNRVTMIGKVKNESKELKLKTSILKESESVIK
jgi:hypothetical protein